VLWIKKLSLSQAITLNIARYKKAVYSAMWVQGTLVVCYLPYGIAVALTPQRGISPYRASQFTATLVFLNSSFNGPCFTVGRSEK